MINEYLAKTDVLVSTHNFLTNLKATIESTSLPDTEQQEVEEELVSNEIQEQEQKSSEDVIDLATYKGPLIEISCDASIKKNPGGPSSVGVVIRVPGQDKSIEIAHGTKSTTNNQAEYDAIYTGLNTLINMFNRPRYPVKVYSDSQLIIRQLNNLAASKDDKLTTKKEFVHALANQIELGVIFEWRPRNSTPDLKQANYLAQDVLGVKRH